MYDIRTQIKNLQLDHKIKDINYNFLNITIINESFFILKDEIEQYAQIKNVPIQINPDILLIQDILDFITFKYIEYMCVEKIHYKKDIFKIIDSQEKNF